jgi:hypothetical protein
MVSKKVIEKLSYRELLNYIKPESRFVSKSIFYAFEVLKERGTSFSESENERILALIHSKESAEKQANDINHECDALITEDNGAVELYSNKVIWAFSVLFGVIFGTALQVYNSLKINDKKGAAFSLIFGILYSFFEVYLLTELGEIRYGKISLRFLLSGLGALGLYMIREKMFQMNVEYRAKSFTIPLLIIILIHLSIIYYVFFME